MNDAPRRMLAQEADAVARLWHDGWHRAHAAFVPAPLVALRTLEEFTARVAALGDGLRVIGRDGAPLGLCAIRKDELYQIYVGAAAQGTGLAGTLLADGEARIAASGHTGAILHCVEQNARARAFYDKHGWEETGAQTAMLDTSAGQFPLRVLVLRKPLNIRSGSGQTRQNIGEA